MYGWTDSPADCLTEAMKFCHLAIALNSQDSTAHSITGTILAISGDAARGLEAGKRAVELNPSSALAHFCSAFPLVYLGRSEESLAGIDRAIRLSPRDPMMVIYYGVQALAYLMLRRFDESIAFANHALQEQPDNVRALLRLAIAEAHNGNLDAARSTYARVEQIMPATTREFFAASHPFADSKDLDFVLGCLRLAGWQG